MPDSSRHESNPSDEPRNQRLARAVVAAYLVQPRRKKPGTNEPESLQDIANRHGFKDKKTVRREFALVLSIENIASKQRCEQVRLIREELDRRAKGPRFLRDVEQQHLVRWIRSRAAQDRPASRKEVLLFAGAIRQLIRGGEFELPSSSWFRDLRGNHKDEFSYKSCSEKDAARAKAEKDVDSIDKWFDLLQERIRIGGYTASQIVAFDETAFVVSLHRLKMKKYLVPKNTSPKKLATLLSDVHFSVLHMCVMNGFTLPPITIYEGEHLLSDSLDHAPDHASMQMQANGYFESRHLTDVLRHIVQWHAPQDVKPTGEGRYLQGWTVKDKLNFRLDVSPVVKLLVIVDNARVHHDIFAEAFAKLNGIELFYLPANLTHRLQVSDIGIFRSLKKGWGDALDELDRKGHSFLRDELWKLLRPSWDKATGHTAVIDAFRRAGLTKLDDGSILVNPRIVLDSLERKLELAKPARLGNDSGLALASLVQRVSALEAANRDLIKEIEQLRGSRDSSEQNESMSGVQQPSSSSHVAVDESQSMNEEFLDRLTALKAGPNTAAASSPSVRPQRARTVAQSNLDQPGSLVFREELKLAMARAEANAKNVKWARGTTYTGNEAVANATPQDFQNLLQICQTAMAARAALDAKKAKKGKKADNAAPAPGPAPTSSSTMSGLRDSATTSSEPAAPINQSSAPMNVSPTPAPKKPRVKRRSPSEPTTAAESAPKPKRQRRAKSTSANQTTAS